MRYMQLFTLADIFNNQKLKGKLPLINYQEKEKDGKTHRTTSLKSIPSLVYDLSTRAAKPFYSPLKAQKRGDTIIIDGNAQGDAYLSVYNAIQSARGLMIFTANNAEMIRHALKETAKDAPKLWLRANSMAQIEGMSKPQLQALMDDIMRNIFYNPEYAKTQKKFNVKDIPIKSPYNYEQRKERWESNL